jgi:integrase
MPGWIDLSTPPRTDGLGTPEGGGLHGPWHAALLSGCGECKGGPWLGGWSSTSHAIPPAKRRRHGAGAVRQLPSGRWQARFRGTDGVMRSAGQTFDTKLDATTWLASQARDVERGIWQPPTEKLTAGTVRSYAEAWLTGRDIKPKTRWQYRRFLDAMILPALGDVPLDKLTPTTVRNWHASLDPTKATWRAHACSLLRTTYTTAVTDDLVPTNPCRIRGAATSKKKHTTTVATLGELEVIVASMPERYRPMVLLAAWCGLRFGELAELRRKDLDLDRAVLQVERGLVWVDGEVIVGPSKTEAGKRRVTLPPHLLPLLTTHMQKHVGIAPSLPRPAPHRGDPRSGHRGHARGPDGPARAHDTGRRHALPARGC